MVLVNSMGKVNKPTKFDSFMSEKVSPSKGVFEKTRGVIAPSPISKPLAARSTNKPVHKTDVISQPTVASKPALSRKRSIKTAPKELVERSSTLSNTLGASRSVMSSSISRSSLKRINQEYPLVPENITSPAMYDDSWLSHQEVILSQLINGLFQDTDGDAKIEDPIGLRRKLLQIYQGPYFTNLYQRLHASMLYGALSIPKHVLGKASRLRQDLGLKRKFIDFWLQTYEPKALRAALETVTGRMITVSKMSSGSLQRPADEVSPFKGKALMKRLEKFLDAFLIQNQDMDQESFESSDSRDKTDAPAALYRRTVLRSMMLVILLDNAKTTTETSLSRCLFLASSPYKSSLAVLQGLARFLLPSCGDINKAIGQLDCQLSYEQRPLDEYNYAISNLAVDLRDGVRLTRIVELLLYPLASRQQRTNTLSKDTPDTQRSLSQRLKLPCLGRAVKAFNVKVALDALATTSEGRLLVSNIRAADIVDGHREKTIALLWGLVSKWGLPGLVDMDDLSQEIGQLKQRAISAGYEVETFSRTLNDLAQIGEPAVLLEQWASLVAQLRGLRPEDLPTNLNGGRVYEYILDEYEGHLIDLDQTTVSTDGKTPLEARLRALGCSSPFVNIVFPSHKTYILDAHSATGALAFLCSRLLPAAKRVRAATVLQSAWRRVLFKRESRKRVMARDIARQCAAVVQTKDRILWAKSVIVHWWRLNRESRRRRRTTVSATRTKSLSRKSTRIPLRCMKHI
ncbi:hypothetical protein BJY04DRAFT_182695 [Aspergillus karnatakaensis]|uniref:putative calmodulin-binding protein Sha1 n=1 Tax=Aspergillus karnatakaensis TaxID=1810916 RepID=UPI003CCDFE11